MSYFINSEPAEGKCYVHIFKFWFFWVWIFGYDRTMMLDGAGITLKRSKAIAKTLKCAERVGRYEDMERERWLKSTKS